MDNAGYEYNTYDPMTHHDDYGMDNTGYEHADYETGYDGSYDGQYDTYGDEGEHNEHDDHEPECLADCVFTDVDFDDDSSICEWWSVEGPSNAESCFNDCSPGVLHVVGEHVEQMCSEEPIAEEDRKDPLECVWDCPIEGLNPHSAESFCPWYEQEKENMCFDDCTDEFMNMAREHAEFTCGEWNQGSTNDYINEPLADVAVEENKDSHILCPPGYIKIGEICEAEPTTLETGPSQQFREELISAAPAEIEYPTGETKPVEYIATYGPEGEHYEHKYEDGEHYESEDHHDEKPKCLDDCVFIESAMDDVTYMCEWWSVESPAYNIDSCLNDCSPGIMHYFEKEVEQMCSEEPIEEEDQEDPFECVMDCPIEDLDPHSAENFCPWFEQERHNGCFYDCTDEFLNMAQEHAEFTCSEWNENQFTNFDINEPIADLLAEENIDSHPLCPAGYIKNGNRCEVCPAATFSLAATFECFPCPLELTSFPGSTSPEECFERTPLLTAGSYDYGSYESEEHSDMPKDHDSYDYNSSTGGEQ